MLLVSKSSCITSKTITLICVLSHDGREEQHVKNTVKITLGLILYGSPLLPKRKWGWPWLRLWLKLWLKSVLLNFLIIMTNFQKCYLNPDLRVIFWPCSSLMFPYVNCPGVMWKMLGIKSLIIIIKMKKQIIVFRYRWELCVCIASFFNFFFNVSFVFWQK